MLKNLTNFDLQALQDAGVIDAQKRSEIETFLGARQDTSAAARFDLTHVLWYLGALIIIGAMGIFTTDAFNRMGGWALSACGLAYAAAGLIGGHNLWTKRDLRIPGGLLIAVAVSMLPMIVYGVQDALDLWKFAQGDPGQYRNLFPYIHGSWIYMELATIIGAGIAAWFYRFPFILLIAAVALWFMSMDVAEWFTATNFYESFSIRRTVSIFFGIGLILVSWFMDLKRKGGPDMSFWLHIAGGAAFFGGLSASDGGTELEKFIYLLINLGLIGLSLFLNRRIYAVFGGMGVAIYLGQLAFNTFKDVIAFSFVLSGIGLAIIFLGIWLHKNRARLSKQLDEVLPQGLKRIRPEH